MQAWGAPGSPGRGAAGAAAAEGAGPWGTPASAAFAGSTIMYGALLLFESEFVHIVAISFTSLILTELLMVALTIQTWHWLMTVAELLSLACYIASLVFLHEFIGKTPSPPPPPQLQPGSWVRGHCRLLEEGRLPWTHPALSVLQALALGGPHFVTGVPLGQVVVVDPLPGTEAVGRDVDRVSF